MTELEKARPEIQEIVSQLKKLKNLTINEVYLIRATAVSRLKPNPPRRKRTPLAAAQEEPPEAA